MPAFSAIVDNATLLASGCNLNIRRYADNAPAPEPHDVRAHLVGGVPKAEVGAEDKAALFRAHGLDPADLLIERDAKYFDFRPEFGKRADIKLAIEANKGLQAKEQAIRDAFEAWWMEHSPRITALAGKSDDATSLVALRNDVLVSFSQSLEAVGMLDPFQVRGIVAGFWNQSRFDFLTLMARGSKGVADAWRTSIVTALEDRASKDNPLEHKLVRFLMGEFVAGISELEAKKAELETQIKAAGPKEADEEGEGAEAAEDDDAEEAVSEEQLKAWKKELSAAKKALKAKLETFTEQIGEQVDGLSTEEAGLLLLKILHGDMRGIVERYIAAQRKQVVSAFEIWWDKYRVTLTEIEKARDDAANQLQGFLKGLAYV